MHFVTILGPGPPACGTPWHQLRAGAPDPFFWGKEGKILSYSQFGFFNLCHLEAAVVESFRGTAPGMQGMKVCLPADSWL